MTEKRKWQEPVVRSIEQLPTVYGNVCSAGNTASGTGVKECSVGQSARPADCTVGGAATGTCLNGGNGSA